MNSRRIQNTSRQLYYYYKQNYKQTPFINVKRKNAAKHKKAKIRIKKSGRTQKSQYEF